MKEDTNAAHRIEHNAPTQWKLVSTKKREERWEGFAFTNESVHYCVLVKMVRALPQTHCPLFWQDEGAPAVIV